MTKVYFTANDREWSAETLQQMLLPLPAHMRHKILTYKVWEERQARIIGKHLLIKLLHDFGLDITLADMRYSPSNKPYFNTDFHFSIAHSSDMVICAGSKSSIGIDIELVAPMDLDDYREYLTDNEWQFIQNTKDKLNAFYELWTKKEALIKALGKGIELELNTIDVSADNGIYFGKEYHFQKLPVADTFIAHVAISAPVYSDSISFQKLSAPL